MAGRVEYSVSLTPIVTLAAVSNASAEVDVLELDIGKTIGASGSIATTSSTAHTTVGYAGTTAGSPDYGNCPVNSGSAANYLQLGADATDYKMVFIKHTGFTYDGGLSSTANTQGLIVYLEAEAAMAQFSKFTIPSKGAVCIPQIDLLADCGIWCESAGDATIAVEYALIS